MLALASFGASAKWTNAAANDDYTVFVDLEGLDKSGNLVKMSELRNFKANQTFSGKQYLSVKSLEEFDCRKKRSRSLVGTLLAGNMGLGKVVHTENVVEEWRPVEAATEGEILWKIACGKK